MSPEQLKRNVKRLARQGEDAAKTAAKGGEALTAASQVIAARMDILADGMVDPTRVDLKEMALMGSEKVEAITASAASAAATLTAISGRVGSAAMEEAAIAARAAASMAGAASPQALAQAQLSYAMGFWTRAADQALTFNGELLKAQAAAFAPIHKAAVANAKRLKK